MVLSMFSPGRRKRTLNTGILHQVNHICASKDMPVKVRSTIASATTLAAVLAIITPFSHAQTRPAAQSSPPTLTAEFGFTGEPIFPGELVSVEVPNAPDFSVVTRVSEGGDISYPYLGSVHLAGLSSKGAAELITRELIDKQLVLNPYVAVSVNANSTGITVLGAVNTPGIYPPTGKHTLSDLLAMAGGMTTATGRIIEVSSAGSADEKTLIPWDPTMHNTSMYDRVISPGSRVLVRPCGVVYVGGNVGKPGVFPLCSSSKTTVSEVVAMAEGNQLSSYKSHTILVRTRPDGSRIVQQIDIEKILKAKAPDPVLQDDDIVYIPLSGVKYTLRSLPAYVAGIGNTLLNVYR
jgi:polysaccharide biosynthesis/export protein